MKQESEFTKYEIARILGARALQVSMDAPLLVKIEKEDLEKVSYDPLRIAELEFNSGVLPITVRRPLPIKKDTKLRRETNVEKINDDKDIEKKEAEEEKDIKEDGEIMEVAQPDDEVEEETTTATEEI